MNIRNGGRNGPARTRFRDPTSTAVDTDFGPMRNERKSFRSRSKAQLWKFHIVRCRDAATFLPGGATLGNAAMSSLKPSQSRDARRLLKWSQYRLAAKANLSETTVRVFENGSRVPSGRKLAAIEMALELAGVEFIAGPPPYVRLGQRNVFQDRSKDHYFDNLSSLHKADKIRQCHDTTP